MSSITLFPRYFAITVKRFKYDGVNVNKIFSPIEDPLRPLQIGGKPGLCPIRCTFSVLFHKDLILFDLFR